jgi:copper resistance protein C
VTEADRALSHHSGLPAVTLHRPLLHVTAGALVLAAFHAFSPRVASASAERVALAGVRHTKLLHSSPSANATLHASPTAVTLWFTKAVQPKLTRVQIADAAGKWMPVDAPRAVDAGDTSVVAGLKGALKSGSYTVTWATTSRDSHMIKGTYRFRVQ